MPIAAPFEGSAMIGITEYSLPNNSQSRTPITLVGVYQIMIYVDGIVPGDQFEVKVYETILRGGTQRIIAQYLIAVAFEVVPMGLLSPINPLRESVEVDPRALAAPGALPEGAVGPWLVIPSVILMHGWDVTARKKSTSMTDRMFLWSLRMVHQ